MKESYKEGDSDSILAPSLAGDIARCRLKRRQGYRWAGLLSFEKRKTRTPTLSWWRKAPRLHRDIASEQSVLR